MILEELQNRISELEEIVNNHKHRGYDRTPVLTSDALTEYEGFTFYESISANDPVRIAFGTVTYLNQTSTSFVDAEIYGTGGTSEAQATKFSIGANGASITTALIYLKKQNSPTDNVVCTIVLDSGGNPTGASQGTVSVAASTVSTSVGPITFTFSSPITLATGTYWVIVSRSGSRDTTNRVTLANDGASVTTSDKQSNSAVWANQSHLSFVVERIDGTIGQIIKATGATFDTSPLIGFALSAVTATNVGLVQYRGIMAGFSGLSPGKRYYLTDAGGVSTTAGTYTKVVGIATSTTEILIQPNE